MYVINIEMKMNRVVIRALLILVCMIVVVRTEYSLVNITYVQSAVAKGAVCLDGSPPAYHFDKGFGTGINNWIVHMEGGGWCQNSTNCYDYSLSKLGNSAEMEKQVIFKGILGNTARHNPDFYNWNRVRIRYCDGGSFTGDVEARDPVSRVYYRGARIFAAIVDVLLEKGLRNAKNALLSGCSTGGLASIHHCDRFRTLFPNDTKVKCVADAGFFVNTKDIYGAPHFEDFLNNVVVLHGSVNNFPKSCTSKMKPSLCFFPQYIVQNIQTPLFIINSAYDTYQLGKVFITDSDTQQWKDCSMNLSNCNATELQIIQGFRSKFIKILTGLGTSTSRGYFISSNSWHCQSGMQSTWLDKNSPMLKNKTIAKAVGDWFYDRSQFQEIDKPYHPQETL